MKQHEPLCLLEEPSCSESKSKAASGKCPRRSLRSLRAAWLLGNIVQHGRGGLKYLRKIEWFIGFGKKITDMARMALRLLFLLPRQLREEKFQIAQRIS